MSTLQVTREVDVDRDSYVSASEQGKNEIGRTLFQHFYAEPVGDVTSTSLTSHKVLWKGTILVHSITTVSVTSRVNQSSSQSEGYGLIYKEFLAQHGHLGEPLSSPRITNVGNEYTCEGQFRVPRERECRLVLNLVEPIAPAAQPDGEEGEDSEEDNDAVEILNEDNDDISFNLKQCDRCNSIGMEGTKCEDGSECDSEAGGWYVNEVDSDDDGGDGGFSDDSDDSSQFQLGRCGVCNATGPQGLKCEFGENCNEDTGGYFSERL